MRYHERLNIIFMRDNGPRHSIRLRRSRFYLLIIFFSCLPFLCLLLAIQCWLLWDMNVKLRANVERFETDYQAAEARAEKLENIEALLREENVPAREIILRRLAADTSLPSTGDHAENNSETVPTESTDTQLMAEGPGHEEFPAINTGRVKVDNVQVRAMRGNVLRIGLDLRNPDSEQLLSGEVGATLVTANGEKKILRFVPENVGSFRINHFKRTVMSAHVPRGINLVNGQIIIDVKNQEGKELYRNIFAIQH